MNDIKAMMKAEAQRVMTLLKERRVLARIRGGFSTPGFYVFNLEMPPAQGFSKLEACLNDCQRDLYAYRAKHGLIDVNDPEAKIVVRAQPQPLTIEVNRPDPQILDFNDIQWLQAPYTALAGLSYLTKDGQPLIWKMTDPSQPHAMVAGGTGSGKSNLLLSLVLSACISTSPRQLGLYIVDGGNSTLLTLRMLPHLRSMATDVESAINMLAVVKALVLDRKAKSLTDPDEHVLLVVDELANLIAVMDKKTCEEFQRDMAVIAAEGRKFGVHMIACTQKPLAETTGSLAKSNFAARFVGAMASKTDANTAAGIPQTGAERLAGKGDFIRVIGGNVRRFQVPLIQTPVGMIRKIKLRWAKELAMTNYEAPIQVAIGEYQVAMEPATGGYIANYSQLREATTRAKTATFPIVAGRPLNDHEAQIVRQLAESGEFDYRGKFSLNRAMEHVYGSRNPDRANWIREAIEGVNV